MANGGKPAPRQQSKTCSYIIHNLFVRNLEIVQIRRTVEDFQHEVMSEDNRQHATMHYSAERSYFAGFEQRVEPRF